jgi:hypothetical protein
MLTKPTQDFATQLLLQTKILKRVLQLSKVKRLQLTSLELPALPSDSGSR